MSRKTNIYKHHEGGLYLVVCKAYNLHTRTTMVIYESLKEPTDEKELSDGGVFARDEADFFGDVVVGGVTRKRFAPVE